MYCYTVNISYTVATTKTFFNLWSADRQEPQRQPAQLIGSTRLETRTISFSSIKLLFVYYTVNIDHSILNLCCYFTRTKVVTPT